MNLREIMPRPLIFILLFILLLVFACSMPSWVPLKKGPPHKAKMKELLDKEVIIIDRQEYVKVQNPRISEGSDQPKYLYIPINEYLAKKETFIAPSIRKEEVKDGSSPPFTKPLPSPVEREAFPTSVAVSTVPDLKKKVVIAHFDDRTISADERLGDWMAEKLMKEVVQRSHKILFVDYPMVKEFLEKRGVALKDLETPKTLHLLNEVFGIQAVVLGELSGPYVFTTKGAKDQDGTSSAIIKIDMRLLDTFSNKTLKTLSTTNPIISTKEKGTFSDEKAKGKAIDLTIVDLGRSLSRELNNLDWFCRIAKVDGEEGYINDVK